MIRPEELMPTYADRPAAFVAGEGSWLYDTNGRAYLDFLSGLAVTSLGHCHPEVVAGVRAQAGRLWHVSNLFANEVGPEVAARLDRLIGGGGSVFLANSGAEANECAIKVARKWAGIGRHGVVTAYGSFHGRTLATLAATGQPDKHEPFEPLTPGFRHVAWDDIEALDAAVDPTVVGAVMLEPIQGEGGVNEPATGYLGEVRRICDERGALMVLDEIQTGLGRTGEWFGFQHEGVRPDVVTVAKALGNGMPVAACWARREVAAALVPGDHGSTFGGQPIAGSAALATLRVMERLDIPRLAARAGERLSRGLSQLAGVEAVRGRGLLLGARLARANAREVVARALEAGLVINAVRPDTLRLAPSLLVTDKEIDRGLDLLGEALG